VETDPASHVEAVLGITHGVFGLCGTSATLAGNRFEMLWRNVRTLSLHDPVDRRREAIGKALLGIADPPIATL
jgi:alkylation response protein AidB-like acyl-CoA dehydrogenase